MDQRLSPWLIVAGALACVAAYYLWPHDEPAAVPVPEHTAVAAASVLSRLAAMPVGASTASAAVTASEPPLIGRNGRIVDLGGLSVAQYVAQREGAARLGNIKAAYEVYQAESLCANTDEPLPETTENADREQIARAQARQRALCTNISPSQVQERMRYLKLAADAGNADAQVDYFMEGPGGKPVDLAANADEPAVKQWKQDAIGYLRTAGAQCNGYALSLLSNAYDMGSMVERDPGLVMAYGIAAARARGGDKTPEQWKRQFGEDLNEADAAAALTLGAQLADGACRSAPK